MLESVLIIDDDSQIAELIATVAEELEFETHAVTTGSGLREIFDQIEPTVIFVDLQMGDTDGIQTLNFLHEKGCKAEIFVVSGFDTRVLKSARDYGRMKGLSIRESIEKPIDLDRLESSLNNVLAERQRSSGADLAAAVADRQFFARFQPKINLATGGKEFEAGEALVRWNHSSLGELPPSEFLGRIEDLGLMPELTDRLFAGIVAQMRDWSNDGFNPIISVNLSPSMLDDKSLPDRYGAIMREAQVAPEKIIFEITESAVMQDTVRVSEICTRIRLKGFGLSIDDFGTGYSSLVELYRMPFDELKIDRMFVAAALIEKEADVIVRTLISMAHGFGMTVCAEGVEDKETLNYLKSLNCDKAQGYLIAKPLLAKDFHIKIDNRTPF